MNIGKYEFGKSTVALSALFLVAGVAYGIYTQKSALTIVIAAMIGSMLGVGIGMIIYPPKRTKE